jgi:hypothetical protein
MPKLQPLRAFVDQINDGIALLLLGEDESVKAHVPVSWLPEGVREGIVLRLSFEIDEAATREGKRRVQSVLDSLGDEP